MRAWMILLCASTLPHCSRPPVHRATPSTRSPPPPPDVTSSAADGWQSVDHEGRWTIRIPSDFQRVTWNVHSQVMFRGPGSPSSTSVTFGLGRKDRMGEGRTACVVHSEKCSTHESWPEGWGMPDPAFLIDVAVDEGEGDVILVLCGGPAADEALCRRIVGTLQRKSK